MSSIIETINKFDESIQKVAIKKIKIHEINIF
jgi:hypothetical protein